MKYFNPSYWFKLWVLSAPLFNYENQGIYAKSIDNNQKIKDWISKDITSLDAINESKSFTNISNYQSYNLNETNQNINPFYQSYLESFSNQQLEINNYKKHHKKREKRDNKNVYDIEYNIDISSLTNKIIHIPSREGGPFEFDSSSEYSPLAFFNKKIYLCDDNQNAVYEYDDQNNNKIKINNNSNYYDWKLLFKFGVYNGIEINSKFYFTDQNENIVLKYNLEKLSLLPEDKRKFDSQILFIKPILFENKLYFLMDTFQKEKNNIWEYNINNKKWREIKIEADAPPWWFILVNKKIIIYLSKKAYDNKKAFIEFNLINEKTKIIYVNDNYKFFDFKKVFVLNNKLYIGSYDGRLCEYNLETGEIKDIIINNKKIIISSGIVLNNKLYIGLEDGRICEYNSETGEIKDIINNNKKNIISSGIVLNNKVYIGLEDGRICEYNLETENKKIIFIEANNNYKLSNYMFSSKNKLYFTTRLMWSHMNYVHRIYQYCPFEECLLKKEIQSLRDWKKDFDEWKNKVSRQIKQDFPTFTNQQINTQKDNQDTQFKLFLNILETKIHNLIQDEQINNIKVRVENLEQKMKDMENAIKTLKDKLGDSSPGLNTCTNVAGIVSASHSLIPIFGTIISAISGTISATCALLNENSSNRKKREIFEEKNVTKWTNEFTKSINNEQHLSINNKPNSSTSNITSL